MEIPIKEIEYLANFVEADTENDLYEISEAVMAQVNIVREWLKAVEQSRALDFALPSGHSGSSLTCAHPFCVAERETQSQ